MIWPMLSCGTYRSGGLGSVDDADGLDHDLSHVCNLAHIIGYYVILNLHSDSVQGIVHSERKS